MADTLSLLQAHPAAVAWLCAVLGLVVGSFLNVVIYRLPVMLEREWQAQCAELAGTAVPQLPAFNLSTPRSTCPHCGHAIRIVENIPLLSYLWLRGRCSACAARIGVRYPLIELLTALLSAAVALRWGMQLQTLAALCLVWALIALTFIDLDTRLLPDRITLPLLWLGLLFNLHGTLATLPDAVTGAIAGYLSLWTVYWLFKLVTGKEGMGYGDFKLLAAIGAWLGWQMLPLVILASSLIGAIVGMTLIALRRQNAATPIPFGPFLAGGGLLALFWGTAISHAWLGLA